MKTSIPPVSRRSFLGLSTLGAAAVAMGAAGCANNSSNAGSTGGASSDKASIVFRNGTIQTMVKEGDTAAALAVSGNKIVYVGEDSGVDEYIDDNTRVIDLDGGMVTPGFMDGHIHAPGNWVTALYEIDLTKSTTIDEYKKVVSDFVTKHPDDEAYVGGSFMINAFEQEDGTNPGPNKSILDEICSDKPIMLTDVSYHSVWVNSRALELAGIDNDTPNPTGGIITRDANGEATGYLIDSAATMMREVVSVEHTDKELENAIDKYQQVATKYGITGITNISVVGETTAQDCQFYTDLEKEGKLNLRMRVLPTIVPGMTAKKALKTVKDLKKFDSNMISTGTVKIYSDGVTEGGSAVMLEPYTSAAGKGDNWYGESVWDQQEFSDMVAALDKEGVQIHVHAIGDGAVHNTLDAYERCVKENGERDDRRNTMTHVCAITDEDIKRVADLDIVCALQFLWMYHDSLCDLEIAMVGEDRAMKFYPVKNMLEAGCFISGASDGPVTGYAPLEEIEVAVTRNSPFPEEEDTDMYRWPEQAITAYQALEAYTKNVAFENYMEDKVGTLEVGKLADLTVLDQDILNCDPKKISDTKVLFTVSDGRIVYEG